jgi:hypothetical protein
VGKRCKDHKQEGDVRRYELRIKMRMQLSDVPCEPATVYEPCKTEECITTLWDKSPEEMVMENEMLGLLLST